jgi:hypothetical protein
MPSGTYKRTKPNPLKGRKRPPFSAQWLENMSKSQKGKFAGDKHPLWGKHHTPETKKKISLAETGRKLSEATKQKMSKSHMGMVSPNKGKTLSKEWREKLSKSLKGVNTWIKGRKISEEERKHRSEIFSGDGNPNWRGGIYPEHLSIRKSAEYKIWRTAVFTRDNWTCIWCGAKGNVHADHIKPFCLFPELRFAIDNGRTLCVNCHKTTETYGNKKKLYE